MMAGDVQPYLDLVIGEHAFSPNLIATLTALLQPVVDVTEALLQLPSDFDIDTAVGVQLDQVGLWVGRTRYLTVPLPNVYFTLDGPERVGLDSGIWYEPFNPIEGVIALPDDGYRILLKADIIANHWDGTISGAYAAWDFLFAGEGITIFIEDLSSNPGGNWFSLDIPGLGLDEGTWRTTSASGNMHMILGLLSDNPLDAITFALFTGGYIKLKPIGVMIDAFVTQSVPGIPYFGLDLENDAISGLDVGAWGIFNPGV